MLPIATDTLITVSSYSPSYMDGAWAGGKNSIFTIEPNEEYTTFFQAIGGFSDPLHWDLLPAGGGDSTVVSNGSKKFVQYYKDPNNSYSTDDLYSTEKYEVVSLKKREQIYRYTFTNKDFK